MDRERRLQILARRLADGRCISGEALGEELGVTRATVSALVNTLRAAGMEIYSVPGKGHRIASPFSLLDREEIRSLMTAYALQRIPDVELAFSVDSTNAVLQRRAKSLGNAHILFAESQTAGRGRRGRTWVSPLGSSLYASLFWRFSGGVSQLGGLSLAVGVAVARAVAAAGVRGVGLKWPNDIICAGRKLGGVLIEIGGEIAGAAHSVIGVGLNVRVPVHVAEVIGQPWTDVMKAGGDGDRNRLAAGLINELCVALGVFEEQGLAPFVSQWRSLDVLYNCDVDVLLPDGTVKGTSRGIDSVGNLLVDVGGELRQFSYGEVSLRAAGDRP